MAQITGSRAYERFTGPQIKHLFKHQPEVYERTERISLISSFLASLFIGKYAPIDYRLDLIYIYLWAVFFKFKFQQLISMCSDGSGMNILDISSHKWDEKIVDLIAPNLKQKLDTPVDSSSKIGVISNYWQRKYGFSPSCEIYAFSG